MYMCIIRNHPQGWLKVSSWVPTMAGGVEKASEVASNFSRKGHHNQGVQPATGAEDSCYVLPPLVSCNGAGDTALVSSRPHTIPAVTPETRLGAHLPLKTQRTPARLQTVFHQRRQRGWTPNSLSWGENIKTLFLGIRENLKQRIILWGGQATERGEASR